MTGRRGRIFVFGAVAVAMLAAPLWADESSSATGPDNKVARLEALLEAQQRKIDALEQQVAAAAQVDANAARVEQMKQQIREVLSEQEFRDSLMSPAVQAGYDKGFFIKSSDDKFMMKFNGLLQFRWTHYNTRRENRYQSPGLKRHDRDGFDIARLRLMISGYAYTKDLTYWIEFDASAPNAYDTRLLYGWINYRIVDEFQIKAGVFRLASTRANFGSSSKFSFIDWPIEDAMYGLGVGTGVRFWGQLFNKRFDYYVDIVNALNGAGRQTITTDETRMATGHDNNPAILARTVWHALVGACSNGSPAPDAHLDGAPDIEHHTEPALDLGFHYAFNDDYQDGTLRIPYARQTFFRDGGFGVANSRGMQINQFGFDASFKYMGFSLTGEYLMRILDVRDSAHSPFSPLYRMTGDDSTTLQQGAYVQAGYFLPIPGLENKLEVVGRVGGISALNGGQEGTWEYAGGLNYYFEGHKVKLQTDVTKVSEVPIANSSYSLANVNDDALIWRVQLQFCF
jgi:phosphate-selective porin OprO and OprP